MGGFSAVGVRLQIAKVIRHWGAVVGRGNRQHQQPCGRVFGVGQGEFEASDVGIQAVFSKRCDQTPNVTAIDTDPYECFNNDSTSFR